MATSDTALAASRSPLCPSAVEHSPYTPAGSDGSSLWFPSTKWLHSADCSESPGSCVLCSLHCPTWDAARPAGHLCHVCKFAAPLPAAVWGLLLSCPPCVPSLWLPRGGAGWGGWSQHSSASDRDGAQLSISSHYQRPAQHFLKESCRCPLPPCFLCPLVEVFSKSVVFSMQINYFKNCFCKYLCEYFSIVFDNLLHFHDLVIAFAGVF